MSFGGPELLVLSRWQHDELLERARELMGEREADEFVSSYAGVPICVQTPLALRDPSEDAPG